MPLQNGYLDVVDHTRIAGWALDRDVPERPVSLIITCNGELLARVLANAFRGDVQAAVGGTGRLSFDLDVKGRLSPLERNIIEAYSEIDGEHLIGSPRVLERPLRFDGEMQAAITSILDAVETEADFSERLAFLAARTEALLALNDRRRHRQHERWTRHRVKWRTEGTVDPMPSVARGPAALVIDARVPVIQRDAGSVAIVSHMLSLQRLGYDVTFIPADLGMESDFFERLRITCFTRPWYFSVEEALARNASVFDLVYVHRSEVAGPYMPLVRRHQPKARVVFSVADLASVRIWRQGKVEERPELLAESQYYAAMESAACHQADAVITHSSFEASILRQRGVEETKIHVVPFVVAGQPTAVPLAARNGLAFIGSFDHRPNADAARWLADAIMPKVAESHPSMPCLLVGSAMTDHIGRLASETIVPMGAVGDLSDIFNRVRLTIAPLAYGAGIKGKVLASLAAGVPCVCTPIATEGMDFPPALGDLIASEPDALAALVVRLHEDEDFNARCSQAGLEYIAARGSDGAVDAAMRRAVAPP
jgi:O-antigen biosynthesis protein